MGEDSDEEMIIIDQSRSKPKIKSLDNKEQGEGEGEGEGGEKRCRIILLEKFSQGGMLVLVNSKSLEVKCVDFGI